MKAQQALTYQDKRYRYDGFDRMIEKRSALRGLQRFTYDAEHRLIEVHNDLNGLPEQLTEPDEHKVWSATYRVWGSTLEEVREPDYIEEQNLRFQGQYLDRETGLHFNTFRFYDPDVGRFTTPDPIGLSGGINFYQYTPNPFMWIDPWGLETCYHKRTKSEIKKIRANFGKKGGAKERYLKKMAKDPKSIQKYGQSGVDRLTKGQVPEGFDVHHKKPIFRGGDNSQNNLVLMDKAFHKNNSKALHWYPEGENPYGLN